MNNDSISVADLKPSMRHENGVLNVLQRHQYISTFTLSENQWLVVIINKLKKDGSIVELNEPYPYHKFLVTEKGIKQITI